jgi:hypothetical protein
VGLAVWWHQLGAGTAQVRSQHWPTPAPRPEREREGVR